MARRTRLPLICALLLATLALAPLRAMPRPHRKANARDQIMLLEQQWRQAQLADDIPAMEKLLSENFIGITITGQVVSKAQQLERMRNRQLVITNLELSDAKVKLLANGQVAIVNSLAEVQGTNESRNINGSYRYTRVYQKTANGAWKITSFEATRVPRNGPGPPAASSIPGPQTQDRQ